MHIRDILKGKILYMPPQNTDRGFEFCGSKVYKGMRIVVGSDWKFECHGGLILDSTRPSKPTDYYLLQGLPEGWRKVKLANSHPGAFFEIETQGCLLTIRQFDPEEKNGIKVRVDVDGRTVYKDWPD